jgi:hypothetical protein
MGADVPGALAKLSSSCGVPGRSGRKDRLAQSAKLAKKIAEGWDSRTDDLRVFFASFAPSRETIFPLPTNASRFLEG